MKSARIAWEVWERSLMGLVSGVALAAAVWLLLEDPEVRSHRRTLVPAVTLYVAWVAWILRPSASATRCRAGSDAGEPSRIDLQSPVREVLPICGHCKAVRPAAVRMAGSSAWMRVEDYVSRLAAMPLSHSICPACLKRYYAEEAGEDEGRA